MQILREYGKRIEFSSEGRVNEGVSFGFSLPQADKQNRKSC